MVPPSLPEALLRVVWSRRLYRPGLLVTADGRTVRVVAPGRLNTDSGPDFRDARIRIGGVAYAGDVEMHVDERGWEAHGHGGDPGYNGVVLHVVLTGGTRGSHACTAARRPVPLLILRPFLDPMVEAQASQLLAEEENARGIPLACAGRVAGCDPGMVARLLERRGIERLELKLRRLQARLRQIADEVRSPGEAPHAEANRAQAPADLHGTQPWEQLLYEGVMEGMGYAKNRTPFLALARELPLREIRRLAAGDAEVAEALLFGAAGLLRRVHQLPIPAAPAHERKLRALWKLVRPGWRGRPLAGTEWLFFRLRPANFPTVRLAGMAGLLSLLFGEEGLRTLIAAVREQGVGPAERLRRVRALFAVPGGAHAVMPGEDRINELIANTVIPVMMLYARTFACPAVRGHTLELLRLLPAGQPNGFTGPIEREFPRGRRLCATALRQQGAINLSKHYCIPRRCAECDIGMQLGIASSGP